MTCVNSPSSLTGIARGGKSPSRILPTEGGRYRAFGPQPRSESAGGADRSPEGDLPRRRVQIRESGDAGGRAIPGRKPVIFAAESGKHPRQPDEGRAEFTYIYTRRLADCVQGKNVSIVASRYTNFGDLLNELTSRLPNGVMLAYGVRQIYTPTTGRRIRDVGQLKDGASYVCAGFETFKPMNYGHQTNVASFVGMAAALLFFIFMADERKTADTKY